MPLQPPMLFTLFTYDISVKYDLMRHGGDTVTTMTFLILLSVSLPLCFISSASQNAIFLQERPAQYLSNTAFIRVFCVYITNE